MRGILLIIALTIVPAGTVMSQEPGGSTDGLRTESAQADVIHDVYIPVREPGILERVLVKEGDWVQAGQTIAELDRRLYELDAEAAKMKQKISEVKATDDVDMRYSTKSKEVAGATLNRSKSAVDKFPNSISATELEQLRLELERATLSIEKAEFERKLAGFEADLHAREADVSEVKLVQRSIRSPIDGLVVEVIPQEGEWLNSGQSIARVVQLDRMRIKALLPSNQINQSFVGRRAVFITAEDGRQFEGAIHFVSPEVVPGNGKVQFWFDVDNPNLRLRRREVGSVKILPAEPK